MKLDFETTNRGFALANFEDFNGAICSLQKSSLASHDAIWLGVDNANPQIMASQTPQGGNGWVPFYVPDGVSLTTRMHLSREQVADLLPALQHFVRTGRLPEPKGE